MVKMANLLSFFVLVLAAKSCPTLLPLHDYSPPGSFCPWDFPGKNTKMVCHFLLHGFFPTQGLNASLLHWQVSSLSLASKEDQ